MGLKLSNNAISRLASGITNSDITISLTPGSGALFPALTAGDWFPATIVKANGTLEIVRVTGRSVDVLTVTRAQESTTAKAFNAGDMIELRLTAGAIATIETSALAGVVALQTDLAVVETDVGTLQTNLGALQTTVATLDSETTASITSLQNQINAIPPAETLPAGFGPIPWSLPTEPSGWIFCDGRTLASGTPYAALRTAYINAGFPFGQDGSGNPKIPDMRGRVPAGKDNMGGTAASRLTTAGSGVDGATLGAAGGAQSHTLTSTEMPSHTHRIYSQASYDANALGIAYGNGAYGLGGPGGNATKGWYGPTTVTGPYPLEATGGGQAHNNTQPTLVVGYIVKT